MKRLFSLLALLTLGLFVQGCGEQAKTDKTKVTTPTTATGLAAGGDKEAAGGKALDGGEGQATDAADKDMPDDGDDGDASQDAGDDAAGSEAAGSEEDKTE
ncbi:MAG: hypothetical protein ACKV0T_08345 [Planctomycetales bacterium]